MTSSVCITQYIKYYLDEFKLYIMSVHYKKQLERSMCNMLEERFSVLEVNIKKGRTKMFIKLSNTLYYRLI